MSAPRIDSFSPSKHRSEAPQFGLSHKRTPRPPSASKRPSSGDLGISLEKRPPTVSATAGHMDPGETLPPAGERQQRRMIRHACLAASLDRVSHHDPPYCPERHYRACGAWSSSKMEGRAPSASKTRFGRINSYVIALRYAISYCDTCTGGEAGL